MMGKAGIIVPDPTEIAQENIASIMAQVAAIQLSLATRLVASNADQPQEVSDNLLTVKEAAARLKCSEDWLYRQATRLPFTVRLGRSLRFSSRGIDTHIRSKTGVL